MSENRFSTTNPQDQTSNGLTPVNIDDHVSERVPPLGHILFETLNPDIDWSDLDEQTQWNFQRAAKAVVREALRQATPLCD